MKILNLYAGIGGNRKLWGDEHEITAVENVPEIAKIYQDFFPNDKVIIAAAHEYLLDHFEEYDFIWSSPPCPSHSKINRCFTEGLGGGGKNPVVYPDMNLYEEIILLQYNFKGKYCVENVVGYYEPLIPPQELAQHYFWTNFYVTPFDTKTRGHYAGIDVLASIKGFNNNDLIGVDKTKVLRNCVEPETGLHIFQEAFREYKTLL